MLSRREQIARAHAPLILAVVQACHNPALLPQMDPILKASADNGWTELVAAIRELLNGRRDLSLLQGLDEEDQAIIDAILQGLQDPASLPKVAADGGPGSDPAAAGPGLATIIHAASRGETEALSWLGEMTEQMSNAGGGMARVGATLGRMANGERDPDRLCKGLDGPGEKLVTDILAELGRLQTH